MKTCRRTLWPKRSRMLSTLYRIIVGLRPAHHTISYKDTWACIWDLVRPSMASSAQSDPTALYTYKQQINAMRVLVLLELAAPCAPF